MGITRVQGSFAELEVGVDTPICRDDVFHKPNKGLTNRVHDKSRDIQRNYHDAMDQRSSVSGTHIYQRMEMVPARTCDRDIWHILATTVKSS